MNAATKTSKTLIDEDVDWAIYGPIDMFPFLGARRGKAAVLEVIRQIAENVRVHRFDRETIMLGVDSASSMMRYSLTALDSNKPISLRLAHFAQFKAGRLLSIRVLVDSFDLVRAGARASDPSAEDRVVRLSRHSGRSASTTMCMQRRMQTPPQFRADVPHHAVCRRAGHDFREHDMVWAVLLMLAAGVGMAPAWRTPRRCRRTKMPDAAAERRRVRRR